MKKQLRVLNVEDSEDDALLVRLALEGVGYAPVLKRVDTPEAMSAALDLGGWDVIISDYVMPHFSGMEALKIAREKAMDIPFIVVSGKIGEDVAVDALKAGANDYVLKSNLSRLVPAIQREIAEAGNRKDKKLADTALRNEVAVTGALLEASAITSAYLDWDELTGKLLELVHGIISSEACAIMMLGEDGMVVPQKAVGRREGFLSAFYSAGEPLKGSGPLERVHDAKKTLSFLRDETSVLVPRRIAEGMGLMEIIISPIMTRETVAGFLCANFVELPKDSRVEAIIEGIAGQLGVAYENTRLYEDTRKRTIELARKVETLKALSEIDLAILSTLDRKEMLSKAVTQVRRIIPADTGSIGIYNPDTDMLSSSFRWGMISNEAEDVPLYQCAGSVTMKTGKVHTRINLAEEKSLTEMDRKLMDSGVRSDMYLPLICKEKWAGLLYLGSQRVAGFTMEDVQTAERLANQIGIALENTRLVSDLEKLVMNVVSAFSSAIDAKSPWTKGHSERVTRYAVEIAERMGLSNGDVETLRLGGLLHDIGKIGTYDVILDKPYKLTEEEFRLIKLHPDRGCEILGPIKQFKDILPIIRHHHERVDGMGYPDGLKGEEIPLLARIVCVADSFDSMTADRPYRAAPGIVFAIGEFRRCAGTQFDPKVLDVFLDILEEEREKKAA